MFKLIFKAVIITVFLVFVTVALAIWKGGEPFAYFGQGVIVVGKSIVKFGDFLDEFKSGTKNIRKSYDTLKDAIIPADEEEKDGEKK